MFAELLRSHGFAAAFLGASTPVDHAAAMLERDRPLALAVSCNLPIAFRGLRQMAEAAHRCGVPALAGGRALGTDARRALRLGADAWGAGVDDAAQVLRDWQEHPPLVSAGPVPSDPAIEALELQADSIALGAFDVLAAAVPEMAGYDDRQVARTKEDLVFIVQFVAAARLVDDPTVLTDFVVWLRRVLAARDVPREALDAGISALAPLIAEVDPEAGRMAVDAIATSPD